MMRTIAVATLLARRWHHSYCLRAATCLECAFNTMAEYREAAAGTSAICMRNTPPMNHPLRRL
jgi:hypothetical protein